MKTRLLSVLCILLMSLGIQAHNLEPLHVDGRYLKNSKGDIVTLHGYMTDLDPYFQVEEYRQGYDTYDVATVLKNKKAVTDRLLASGWKMDYVRLKLASYWCMGEGQPSWDVYKLKAFDFNRFKKYFEELFLPLIEYYHEKGIYTLLWPPYSAPGHIEMGDEYQQHLLLVWDYVSNHPRIRNNPGVMFELINEPVYFNSRQVDYGNLEEKVFIMGTLYKEVRDYWQPIVDNIRSHCDNIIYIPGLKCQTVYAGFAEYPVEGSNIGYAVHCYPGADNLREDWNNFKFPAAYVAPIIITESAWAPYDNYLEGANTTTSKFGRSLKYIIDELGNVSWNCYEPCEDFYYLVNNTSSQSERAIIANDPEACFLSMYQWWNEYAKTKVLPISQLNAKSVSFEEFPKSIIPGERKLAKIKAEFTNGMTWDVSGDAEYTVADESILSINHGVIRALKEGSTSVMVKYTDGTGQTFSHKFEVTSTLFPLTEEGFDPGDGTFDETTGTFSSVGYNMGGWSYGNGLDFSPYKYLVVQLNQEQQCWAMVRIGDDKNWDENDAWDDNTDYYGFGFNDATELVIDLQSLHKKNGEPLDLSHICHVGIWINGELGSVSIKRAFLSNDGTMAVFQEPTCVYADQKAIYYGDDFPALTYSVSGPPINGIPTLSTTANSASSVGTYPITTGRGSVTDEQVSFIDGELTIFKAPLTVGVKNETISQGDEIPAFTLTYDGLRNNDTESNTFITKPVATTIATPSSPPGEYLITIDDDGEAPNYKVYCQSGKLTIKEKELPPLDEGVYPLILDMFHQWDGCSAKSKVVIGKQDDEIHLGETITAGGLVYGRIDCHYLYYADLTRYDSLAIVGTPGVDLIIYLNRKEAGNGDDDECGGSYTELNLTIGPTGRVVIDLSAYEFVHLNAIKIGYSSPEGVIESLSLIKGKAKDPFTITAKDLTMTYGDEVPEFAYNVEGGELNGTPKLSTTATKTSPVGIYPIKVEKGTVTNEKVTYVEGTLTIIQSPLTVGVQDVTITEGDAIPSFTLTYSGFKNDDTEANAFTTKPTATTTATSSSAPGTYPITVSGGEAKNYTLNYQIGTLTILEDENPATYRTYPLTLDIFHEWDGCTATSKIVNNDYQGEIHVGEKLAAAELIYGDMAVYYTHYADVTKYNQLLIEGTPGMELRVLLNRLEVGNGGGDDHGGGWTELNPVIGDDGKAIVDLSDYEFVHLNAIKTGWESPEGVIDGLYLVKGKIEQPVTITANDLTMVYGDDIPTLTYSSEGGELNGTPKLSTTATKNSPVGTYPIKVEKGTVTNEKVTCVDGTLTITQAPLTVGVQDMTITEGDAIPSFTLTYSGFKNSDTEANAFTMKPTATTTATVSSMPGTYPISVSGGESKNYALNYQSGTLTILEDENPASYRTYTLTPDIFHEWDGCTATSKIVNNDYQGEIHVGEKLAAAELIYGDMAVYYTHYADVTKYNQLLIEGTPGMELRVLLNRLEVGNGGGDENGGSWTELNPVIGDDGKAIVDLPNLEFVHLNAIKMGWESQEGVIKSLYLVKGKIEQPVTITANNLTVVYGDDLPMLTYSSEGGELKGTPKLSTTATKNSPVGTYPIKVEKGTVTNEKVTYVEGTLTITQAPLTVSVQDVTITEGDAIPSFTLTYSGFRNSDTEANAFTKKPTAKTTATSSSKPGTYPITVSGGEAKNYALTYTKGTLTIKEKPVIITANNLTMVYGDDVPALTYSSEGGELKGTPKLSTTATKRSAVGTYPIKVEKGTVTNEQVTYVEGTLTITQAPLTVGVQDVTITEGDAIPSFTLTYSGFRNSDTESNAFSKKPTAKTTATSSSKPGTYPITVSGGEAKNYALTYTKGTLTIKEKPVTITANNLTMVYGDEVPTLTYKSSGAKLNGTPKLSTTATKKSAVGTYPIKVEKGTVTNGQVTYVDGTLTIVKAPLTVGVVDVTITEGDDIPTFTLTYSGFRNNDYANRAFTKMPTATTTATSNSVAGTYPITISGGVAKNYEPTYKPGTLTIEPAAGIESVYADGQGNGVIYNVNGQKLSKPRKGINIIGGKKIVVKKDQTP